MVSFSDMVGGETGEFIDFYFFYIFCILLFGIVYYIGVFNLLYKMAQQVFIISMMCGVSLLWWLLISKHLSFISETTFTNPNANAASKSLGYLLSNTNDFGNIMNDIANESLLIAPLSEIILITGITIVLLSWLYRQLPIDLIPDCIPCIGKYDNIIAGMCLFGGIIVTIFGVWIQFTFVSNVNSSQIIYDYFSNFSENFRVFLKHPTEKQLEIAQNVAKNSVNSLIRFGTMIMNTVGALISNLQVVLAKQEL